jgi:hypothetical protein
MDVVGCDLHASTGVRLRRLPVRVIETFSYSLYFSSFLPSNP